MHKYGIKNIRIILAIALIASTAAVCYFARGAVIGTAAQIRNEFPYEKTDQYARDFSSHLPLLVLQTDFSELSDRDTPPLSAMWLFDGEGVNRLSDIPTETFHSATARYRGNSSLSFPKKPYRINLYNHENFYKPLDYSFFGLGSASEWALRPPYADKSLLRDWFSYEIAATVLDWQPRGKPVELFLQDGEGGMVSYQGVYFFSELITAGNERLDLGRFRLNDSEGVDSGGGGYIYQLDRPKDYSDYFTLMSGVNYRLMHPGRNSMTARQEANFIKEISFYHGLLTKTGIYEDIPEDNWDYWDYIDVDSFIDYFLVAELIKNVDAGDVSTFMYRPAGGKLVMGPLWDCDLSMGNHDFSEPEYHSFLIIDRKLTARLIENKSFSAGYVEKWRQYRSSIWSDEEIFGLFDSMVEYLAEPAARNALRWPEKYDGKTYIWPNPEPYVTSWEEEIERTRSWLVSRLEWLDEHIPMLLYETAKDINARYRSLYADEEEGVQEYTS